MSNDWISWSDKKCPVDDGTEIEMKYRDEDICSTTAPQLCRWGDTKSRSDIVAYRVVKETNMEQAIQEPAKTLTERPKDDWILWSDRECPVDGETLVEVKFGYCDVAIHPAKVFYWPSANIVAYRVVKETNVEHKTEMWMEWNGGNCPVDADATVKFKLRNGKENQRIARYLIWTWDTILPGQDIVAYQLVKENTVEQPKLEPAKKPHKHAAMIAEWIKDTSRVVEFRKSDGSWVKASDMWDEEGEYRFADEVKPGAVSPLSDQELMSIWLNNETKREIANEIHKASIEWVASLPAVTSLTDAQRISYQSSAQREAAAIAQFQSLLKMMLGQ